MASFKDNWKERIGYLNRGPDKEATIIIKLDIRLQLVR
jgi:hypothetical protein